MARINRGFKLLLLSGFLCSVTSESSTTSSASSPTTSEKYPFFPHSAVEEERIRKMVDDINSAGLTWKAEYNAQASLKEKFRGLPRTNEEEEAQKSLKLDGFDVETSMKILERGDTDAHLRELSELSIALPESFDARVKWPRCASIHNIQNQGGCGSCWAAATVSILSDRLCISSSYTEQHMVSLQDLVSCCEYCGKCNGGSTELALLYWTRTGIVTGGSYGSNEGCKPYEVESTCGVPCPAYFYNNVSFNPSCQRKCNKMYGKDYETDLRKGKTFYYVKEQAASRVNRTVSIELIKKELITYGPVSFSAPIDEPFAHYRSGIYDSSPFIYQGHDYLRYGHVMRIIGWGRENREEFWTIANSWGRQWGENGFGRISIKYPMWNVHDGLW